MSNKFPTADKIWALIGIVVWIGCWIWMPLYFAIKFGDYESLIPAWIFILIFGFVFFSFRTSLWTIFGFWENNYILKNWIEAKAKILKIKDTGITINNWLYFMIDFVLEVKQKYEPKYETKIRAMISRINISHYQPWNTIEIKIHPKDNKKVAIVV